MRYIQIIILSILFSCNSASGTQEKVEAPANSTQNSPSKNQSNDGFVTDIPDPLLGGPADIKATINGVQDGDSFLIGYYAEGHFRTDSTGIKNGKLAFKNPEGFPQGVYFISLPTKEFVQVILGEDQKFELSFDASDIVGSMTVKGSTDNTLLYDNLRYEADYNNKFKAANNAVKAISDKNSAEYKAANGKKKELEESRRQHLDKIFNDNKESFFVSFKKSGQNPVIREGVSDTEMVYFYRNEFWDNVDFSDRRLIRTPVIINKLNRYFKELTPQNPDSIFKYAQKLIDRTFAYPEYYRFFTNWVAIQYEPTKCTLMDPEAVFVNMVQNYFTRERAFWADSMEVYALQQRSNEMAQSLVGNKAPDVVSTDQFGNTKSIYEKTADYIIVYLYNPTCEHCLIQTPKLVQWYNEWKNKGGDVYAIAIDTNEEEWKNYIKEKNMTFTNVYDPTNRSIYAKYYVDITPEIYVLNKDRIIIGKNLKVDQIETIINRDKGLE